MIRFDDQVVRNLSLQPCAVVQYPQEVRISCLLDKSPNKTLSFQYFKALAR